MVLRMRAEKTLRKAMNNKAPEKAYKITFESEAIPGIVLVYLEIALTTFGSAAYSCIVEVLDSLRSF